MLSLINKVGCAPFVDHAFFASSARPDVQHSLCSQQPRASFNFTMAEV